MNHGTLRGHVPAVLLAIVAAGCAQNGAGPTEEVGVGVERIVSGSWEERFSDDPSVHRTSLPPGVDVFDAWAYQFGESYEAWAASGITNMECGPACVSTIERMTGRIGADCSFRPAVDGCPSVVHTHCRRAGDCGAVEGGFRPSSSRGNLVSNLTPVLEHLGHTVRTFDASTGTPIRINDIQNAILADHPVIVAVDVCEYASELAYSRCSRSHFIVVYGFSDRYIYILDPGYRNGQRARISRDAFTRALRPDPSGIEVIRPGFGEFPNATWYPPGTLLHSGDDFYLVAYDSSGPMAFHASPEALRSQRIPEDRAIEVPPGVLTCIDIRAELDPVSRYREYRNPETRTIFLVDIVDRRRFAFLTWEAYLTWNGRDEWRTTTSAEASLWASWSLAGNLGFAPGTLVGVTTPGDPRIWVVTRGAGGPVRMWIVDEQTARVFGYPIASFGLNPRMSARIPTHDLDRLAGPAAEHLREELARDCRARLCISADACFIPAFPAGSPEEVAGEQDDVPEGVDAGPPASADAGMPSAPDAGTVCTSRDESCNGLDDDCDRVIDNGGVCDPPPACAGGTDRACSTSCGSTGSQHCYSDGHGWAPCWPPDETCNGRDDDCDGLADEVCAPPPVDSGPPSMPDAGPSSIPDAGPVSCGHEVRVRFSAYAGAWQFGYGFGTPHPSYEAASGAINRSWSCVRDGWLLLNGSFPGSVWMCGEWPAGIFQVPYGLPEVTVDGFPATVTPWHNPGIPGEFGCDLRVCVGGSCS